MITPQAKEPRLTFQSMRVLDAFLRDHQAKLAGADIHSVTGLPSGTLYPILARFESAGWLKSEWENVDPAEAQRPRRRYYSITPQGIAKASESLGVFGRGVPA